MPLPVVLICTLLASVIVWFASIVSVTPVLLLAMIELLMLMLPSCGPPLAFLRETLPFMDLVRKVLTGDGQCAKIEWTFLGQSMPVWTLRNSTHVNRAYSNMNEGLGKVLRFGANGPEVIARLKWMRDTLKPVVEAGLKVLGPPPFEKQEHVPGASTHKTN